MLDSHQLALLRQEIACAIQDGITAGLPSSAERRTIEVFKAATFIWLIGRTAPVTEGDAVAAAMRILRQAARAVAEEAAPDPPG